jgi:hypothetical protein
MKSSLKSEQASGDQAFTDRTEMNATGDGNATHRLAMWTIVR